MDVANTLTEVEDISPLGVAVRVSYPLPVDSEWPLALHLPHAVYRVTGRVVHCAPATSAEGKWVVGLCFVDLSQDTSRALQQYLRPRGASTVEDDKDLQR